MNTLNFLAYAGERGKSDYDFQEIAEKFIEQYGPSGSGIDCGTKLVSASKDKIALSADFHHMDEYGSYDGWTDHIIKITPSFIFDFDIKITGNNRNEIKDELADLFSIFLSEDVSKHTGNNFNFETKEWDLPCSQDKSSQTYGSMPVKSFFSQCFDAISHESNESEKEKRIQVINDFMAEHGSPDMKIQYQESSRDKMNFKTVYEDKEYKVNIKPEFNEIGCSIKISGKGGDKDAAKLIRDMFADLLVKNVNELKENQYFNFRLGEWETSQNSPKM